jgi:16S rRNA (uracil1498-N3)-methyltransferase
VQLKGERIHKRSAHWQGVIIAACEQSGRNRVPVLYPVDEIANWLSTHDSGLLLHHRATQALVEIKAPVGTINLLIGPEGGLAEFERELAVSAGFTAVRLGPRVLRTETAPLAAISAIQALWGDFRDLG